MNAVAAKVHKCRSCKQPYPRLTSFQTRCVPCLAKLGRSIERKAAHKAKVEAKQRAMGRREWLERAQKAFNRWVRLRDAGDGCISCGNKAPRYSGAGHVWDAGHYRSRQAAPELALHPDNCHLQCTQCNTDKAGNAVEYRIRLVRKIGVERVEWLEGPHEPLKLTAFELQGIEAKYKALAKELEARRDAA